MTKVNIEGFVEVECPNLNEATMKVDELNISPKLKVQLFINREEAIKFYKGYETDESRCTKIICTEIAGDGKCGYDPSNYCLYANLSIAKKTSP